MSLINDVKYIDLVANNFFNFYEHFHIACIS